MRFWWREAAGWALVGLGLVTFYRCYTLLVPAGEAPRIIEAGPLAFIGFVVFRGGIHLLKVAVAARVCIEAKEQGKAAKTIAPAAAGRRPAPFGRIGASELPPRVSGPALPRPRP
jgi:hypothetical protein